MATLMTIFAHQDDETFSAGGVLAKYESAYAVTVTADPKRELEFQKACEYLGATPVNLNFNNVTAANEDEVLKQLTATIRQYKPDVVITHNDFDYHHEHRRVNKLVKEAIEWASHTTSSANAHQVSSLWVAETTVLIPFPHIFIDVSAYNDIRLKAISCYASQLNKGGSNFYSEFHNTRTRLRGIQSNVEHAEAFLQVPIALTGSFKPVHKCSEFPEFILKE